MASIVKGRGHPETKKHGGGMKRCILPNIDKQRPAFGDVVPDECLRLVVTREEVYMRH